MATWQQHSAGGMEAYGGRALGPVEKFLVTLISLASAIAVVIGLVSNNDALLFAGGAGVTCAILRLTWRYRRRRRREKQLLPALTVEHQEQPLPTESHSLVQKMLFQGRGALLLRPQVLEDLEPRERELAFDSLDHAMTLVPSGEVVIGAVDEALDNGTLKHSELPQYFATAVRVEDGLLDRYPITNRQFLEFVRDGGYETLALWDEAALPAVFEFVDRTGLPGPKFWSGQCYHPGEADHPVVGVSWYEAVAYARWVGKRLPTDSEWVKAGCWPVMPRAGMWVQRKYPWGNTFDSRRANLWVTGMGRIVSVYDFPEGASVGGAYQLVGNVWEWTSSNFGFVGDINLSLPVPMKSIRGGAFDTYFESQATCHFQSGENPLSRKHNIGFRLAIGIRDLAPEIAGRLIDGESVSMCDEVCV